MRQQTTGRRSACRDTSTTVPRFGDRRIESPAPCSSTRGDSPLGGNGMHDPEAVPVKQRVELGPQWAKAAGLDLHELSVSADQVNHEPADRHLEPVTRRRQQRLDCGVQRALAQHADARHSPRG